MCFFCFFLSQVYPTVARSLGMGFCTSFSRIGGMIAPFIAQVGSAFWLWWISQVSVQVFLLCRCNINVCLLQVLMSRSVILALSPFAVACVVCALGNFLLPIETKGRALLVRNKPVFTFCTDVIFLYLNFMCYSFSFSKTPDLQTNHLRFILSFCVM